MKYFLMVVFAMMALGISQCEDEPDEPNEVVDVYEINCMLEGWENPGCEWVANSTPNGCEAWGYTASSCVVTVTKEWTWFECESWFLCDEEECFQGTSESWDMPCEPGFDCGIADAQCVDPDTYSPLTMPL